MHKHILYSIPLAGLALTSVGCEDAPDKIIDTFEVDTVYGLAVPNTREDLDIEGDGSLICDVISAVEDFTIDASLTGELYSTISYANCFLNGAPDPASEGVKDSNSYAAVTTIITANATYSIALTSATGANTLACELSGANLSCLDDNDALWTFTAQ